MTIREVEWRQWRGFRRDVRFSRVHLTEDGVETLCGWPIPSDSRGPIVVHRRCANCRRKWDARRRTV
jgi:hypothetical protein